MKNTNRTLVSKIAAGIAGILLAGAISAFGQQQINLSAGPTSAVMPDGTAVPMWGYSCGGLVTGSTATCAALNSNAGGGWSPVVITVPTGQGLTINLTNNLTFTGAGIPTSIVIVGQVGGGLGVTTSRTTTASPSHTDAQGCPTWFIASTPPGTPCTTITPLASPPNQANRVQSMATEVIAGATTATPLTWKALKPGTYLLESGTHPSIQVPMGLIGMLVVTAAPSGATAGTAYPATATSKAVPYNSEVPLEFSEIDPVQNSAVSTAVNTAGFSETKVWSGMIGQCGNPNSGPGVANTCYPPAVNYTPLYYLINGVAFSKNNASASVFAATAGVTAATPPVPVTTGITGTVLVRVVNAGLHMHVPSIVNSMIQGFTGAGVAGPVAGFALIAEDGNVLPNVAPLTATTVPAAPRVQTDVLMVPSKVYDLLVNVPTIPTGGTVAPSLPIYDRELSLSANSSVRDAGMVAYIGVNGSGLPAATGGTTGVFASAVARADTYNALAPGKPLSVTDTSKGVIANDTNVYGVTLLTAPAHGALTCPAVNAFQGISNSGLCANGTFTYTPSGTGTTDSFSYCANGTVSGTTCSSGLTATVTLGGSTLGGNPSAVTQNYTAATSTFIKIPSPGLLLGNSDPSGLPLSIVIPTTAVPGVTFDGSGGFTMVNTSGPTTATFSYTVQDSQGRTATGTANVIFPTPSNLQVKVLDAQLYSNCHLNSGCINGLAQLNDYRWIIEEDKTFYVDPNCTTNSSITTAGCPTVVGTTGTVPTFGVNFHTSTADFVAQGCTGPLSCEGGQTFLNPATGMHDPAVCDVGNGACRPDPNAGTTSAGFTQVLPSSVHLDPTKRYYLSVLPGDAANPFPAYLGQPSCTAGSNTGTTQDPHCGHTMSGTPIAPACNILLTGCTSTSTAAFAPVNVLVAPTPLPTGKLSVLVFEDDFPLNGEQDGGGGVDTIAPVEPGLGGFNLVLWDTYGTLGDATGQNTYDEFNQPLSNSLAGTIDPTTQLDACPLTAHPLQSTGPGGLITGNGAGPAAASAMTGMIVTCPKYESDGKTLSPLAGQAIIANLMPEKFSVQAYPGADRIARGEEWLQTNTLDGQHPHDSFIRIGEPSYFQEYGPAGYHVMIGFANPAIINARHDDVCKGAGSPGAVGPCTNTITGQVDVQRLSRTPDQRLYPSGSRDAFGWSQCWVSLGDPDAEDFMFTKCDASGNFKFMNVPGGNWRLTIGDQWNDQIIDGLSTPANVGCISAAPNQPTNASTCPGGQTLAMGNIGVQQWQSNLNTRTFIDDNKNGIWDPGEIGIPFIYTMIHYRDGHTANNLSTDFNGVANFNETFPLFNWYVVESDSTRYKTTGIHTVYDAGGPADGSPSCTGGAKACGTSTGYSFLSNTSESVPLPADLSVPGAVYCGKADCSAEAGQFAAGTAIKSSATASTGRIDPPWVWSEGFAGITGLSNWIDFGKAPYASCPPACVTVPSAVSNATAGGTTATTTQAGENGGIHGFVAYASTRPFDSAEQMIQQPWEPNIPNVTVNLYQEGFAADGVSPTLTLVDTTQSSSWDAWAQGFYPGSSATPGTGQSGTLKPYMNCPGQGTGTAGAPNQDPFYFTLFDQPNYLDWYNSEHNGGTLHPLPYNAQYKCYDSMHIGNQLQPAPYDGRYFFPSSLGIDSTTGKLLAVKGSTNGVASSMNGTNCTVCVGNPDSTDKYRVGTPMLPPGKYVVQVIMPAGYEVYKEEDKNLLIGDNFIAPVTQQFGGLGTDIFIIPDQASVASLYDPNNSGFNPTNYQNQTSGLDLQGGQLSGVPGFPGFQDPLWPCVGEMRVVPDYLSLFPNVQEVAPFAGATRPLCDRKEVTLANQMSVSAKFYLFTSTHIASKYTGGITDDFTSEFDPFSPQFGEKFAPPNMPVSTRDYLGNELSRVYSDHWGTYDGLTFSSWEVNPPNITGYSPSMMVQCMNDPGPIPDGKGGLMNDPLYNPAYSNFCYEDPFMPGLTDYLDTPVVPTQAFVGAGYNNPDCAYPDATPAVKEVDSSDGIGPWVLAAGTTHTLTITALGDVQVQNSAYSGPSANTAPFNLKTIPRHYGFGGQCTAATATASSPTCNTVSSVKIGGVTAPISSWNDGQIVVTVPSGVPNCTIQQQTQYNGAAAQCGELVITAGNGKQSIDSVSVTIGGKPPTHVNAQSSVQSAIDAAMPGDLIMVDPTCTTVATTTVAATTADCSATALHATTPTQAATVGSHTELLIMWKPVRLQGVGAASSIINATAFPAGKLLDPWRRHINCLFGLTLSGVPYTAAGGTAPYDPNGGYSCPDPGWNYFTAQPNSPQVDRLPLEATIGWDATLNGNLAEQLQEPSLMGAFEGAGITVLAKGLEFHGQIPWSDGNEVGGFPTVTTLLTGVGPNPTALAVGDASVYCHTGTYSSTGAFTVTSPTNPYPSNYMCNPSSIDGLSIASSSQGGGGIFAHGWAHHLEIANNRIFNNAGTLTGGISVGQGEFAGPYIQGSTTNAAPGSCSDGTGYVTNQHLPYCLQLQANIHNNYVTNNSSLGDELFSGTLAGGGGVTFCTGNDYYKFQYNWVCGNISAGEGGGLSHLGEIQGGDIEHNSVVFNQSQNPTIPTNGGGIQVTGTPDTDPTCGTQLDADCPPGLSDGIGHNLVINANLIQGNSAESGSGGGIRLQQVNGTDVATFPTQPSLWNSVSITNNIISNNAAGWDGAGISLQDSLNVSIINNTISSNDALATSGVLTQSIGTPDASAPAGSCVQNGPTGPTSASCPQSAGVTSTPNSSLLTTSFTNLTITCPTGTTNCMGFSNPVLQNNIIWQNRSFYIGITKPGIGNGNQQNIVGLFNAFTGSAAPVQATVGQCSATVSYWDIGVRGDTAPNNHGSGYSMNPVYSLFDDPEDYPSNHNLGANPAVTSQYCNGSRVPPTCSVADGCGGPSGYGVPPGIVDASTPNPVFSLTPSATVDEGNNWINVSWGPLAATDDSTAGGARGYWGGGATLANYVLTTASPAIDYIPNSQPHPSTDFFGNPRPDTGSIVDIGAVEYQGAHARTGTVYVSPTSLDFLGQVAGTASAAQTLTVTNGTAAAFTLTPIAVTAPFARATAAQGGAGSCGATLAAGATCTINVVFMPTLQGSYTGTASIGAANAVVGSPVTLNGTAVVPVRTVNVSPTTLAFGSQGIGLASAPQTLTVTNTGNVALTAPAAGAFTFGGGTPQPFTRANILQGGAGSCGGTLAAGASCTFNVVFTPATGTANNTAFSRTVAVAYTGATVTGSPVTLTGTAVTPGRLAFTRATNGTLSALPSLTFNTFTGQETSIITVTNTGAGTLTITGATISLDLGAAFNVIANTCTTLAPNGTCQISVQATGLAFGALSVANNGTGTTGGTSSLALIAP